MSRLQELRAERAGVASQMVAVLDLQEEAGVIPTEDDEAEYQKLQGQLDALDAKIDAENTRLQRRHDLAMQQAEAEATAEPADRFTASRIVVGRDRAEDRPFPTFGHFLQAVASAGINRGQDRPPGLIWAAATGAGEAVPSEGGFLVQKDHSEALLGLMHDQGQLIGRVRNIPISGGSNGIKLPIVDETSRVNGSRWGGVTADWADEGGTATASRPKFGRVELDLKKLIAIGYVTEELLRDASALEAVMTQAFTEELLFKTEDAIVNGTGSGQPLGFMNSGALVTVAKESGQANATVVAANILNMWSRMPARQRASAVWLINQEIEPQLHGLVLGTLVQMYRLPGSNDVSGVSQFGTLMGRPVIPVEYCAALGTVGDIALVSLSEYLMIEKGGVRTDSSMHVRFLQDEMTFRFIHRVDGQPAWKSPVTPYKGTATFSPFVALATRSS